MPRSALHVCRRQQPHCYSPLLRLPLADSPGLLVFLVRLTQRPLRGLPAPVAKVARQLPPEKPGHARAGLRFRVSPASRRWRIPVAGRRRRRPPGGGGGSAADGLADQQSAAPPPRLRFRRRRRRGRLCPAAWRDAGRSTAKPRQ